MVVAVAVSFYIIFSCIYISLLLIMVGIIYIRMGNIVNVIINILFDGETISFDASLVIQGYS